MILGVVSDTHGVYRPAIADALRGVELILHAGDIGHLEVLDRLEALAPVRAVCGNVDDLALPRTEVVEAGGALIYLIHDLGRLDLDPVAAGMAAVVSGHTHRPEVVRRGGVLYLNPGSAGPRRFNFPVSVALLHVDGKGRVEAELIDLAE